MTGRLGVRRGFTAGLAATAAMTASYGIERRLRHSGGGPLDYDDSTVPSHAAMVVLGIHRLDRRRQRQLGFLVHWGYGSAMGWVRTLLGDRMPPAAADGLYWAGLMAMAGTLFPLLGDTPPPWRWKPDVLATSLFQHGVYAVVAGAVSDRLR
ncbi:MAG TPA: hypothetical protein VFN68_13370 [Acidimicrobiales bacterium]|nr:hypothetical protein [Acidimicrobiales bacterium]